MHSIACFSRHKHSLMNSSRRIALDRLECSRTDRCLLEAPWRGYVSLRRLQARRRQPFVDVRGGIYLASLRKRASRFLPAGNVRACCLKPFSLIRRAMLGCNGLYETVSLHDAAACNVARERTPRPPMKTMDRDIVCPNQRRRHNKS